MDRNNHLHRANIDNLTALWRAAGAECLPGPERMTLYACNRWPHRHWFHMDTATSESQTLQNALRNLPPTAMVPVWDASSKLEPVLRNCGFQIGLEQQAMHLELSRWRQTIADGSLRIRRIELPGEIQTWVALSSDAFGYNIDTAVIARLARHADTSLWLAEIAGEAVGTALLFQTGKVTGIHQVGVPDAFRGKGIARRLMQTLLNHCQQSGAVHITLQASKMGEGLYRQLGFAPQFPIYSYHRS